MTAYRQQFLVRNLFLSFNKKRMLGPLLKPVLCRFLVSWERVIPPEDHGLKGKGQYSYILKNNYVRNQNNDIFMRDYLRIESDSVGKTAFGHITPY